MPGSLDSVVSASGFSPDSRAAWVRLALVLAIGSIGNVGMWSVVVVIPAVQADFGASRGATALAFTFAMLGFGLGGIGMGRLSDRLGLLPAIAVATVLMTVGYVGAGYAAALWQFHLMHLLIGFGAATYFGPLITEASHWFDRRRGLAMGIAATGNYVAGVLWPTLIERGVAAVGWRTTHIAIGIGGAVLMLIAAVLLRSQIHGEAVRSHANAPPPRVDLNLSPNALTAVLSIAAVACCVAMAMPQVHIVAYCGDLGYGVAHGAEMLSLMLGLGIVSRISSGFLADRIGGLRTLLIGSVAQGVALLFYLFFDSLTSLYLISAMFGLFQGGIVPSYAIIARETMPSAAVATRLGIIVFASVAGMSFGGWISGVIFDMTGSYAAAFLNGLGWNALNVTIAVALVVRARGRLAIA